MYAMEQYVVRADGGAIKVPVRLGCPVGVGFAGVAMRTRVSDCRPSSGGYVVARCCHGGFL